MDVAYSHYDRLHRAWPLLASSHDGGASFERGGNWMDEQLDDNCYSLRTKTIKWHLQRFSFVLVRS